MYNEFKGKIAVVTGGASGIGLAVVTKLLGYGAKVAVADISRDNLDNLKKQFPDSDLFLSSVDVSDEQQVSAFVNSVNDKFGSIHYAFLIAGINLAGSILNQDTEKWEKTVKVNLHANYYFIKYVGNVMKANQKGAFVVVSSLNAHVPMLGGSGYASSKAGMEMLVRNASIELAQEGIRINAVLPGLVDTPLTSQLFKIEEIYNTYMKMIPEKRPASTEEIANPIIFLASDQASYINGTSLVVDGGWENTGYGGIDFRG